MKKLFSLAICCCIAGIAFAQYNAENLSIKENEAIHFTYKNLRIYPVYAAAAFIAANKNVGSYLSLDSALAQKKVAITEQGGAAGAVNEFQNNLVLSDGEGYHSGGATVNTLSIENLSNDTIMLIAGQVVKGGQQDRVIASDMILAPKSGKVALPVFCVEHGRWTPSNASNSFNAFTDASTGVRKQAVVNKSQQGVWSEVHEVTTKNNASTTTGTFAALDTSKAYNADQKGYIDFFTKAIGAQQNVIGMVVCTGDSILGCDMFATPEMFNSYLDNLLKSYSGEAISHGAAPKVSFATVQGYMNQILADESKQDAVVEQNGTILKSKGRKLHIAKF